MHIIYFLSWHCLRSCLRVYDFFLFNFDNLYARLVLYVADCIFEHVCVRYASLHIDMEAICIGFG